MNGRWWGDHQEDCKDIFHIPLSLISVESVISLITVPLKVMSYLSASFHFSLSLVLSSLIKYLDVIFFRFIDFHIVIFITRCLTEFLCYINSL